MKKNRKRTRRSVVYGTNVARVGVVIVLAAAMYIVGMLAHSRCDRLMKTIGEKERTLNALEEARQRESARWEAMKSPERIEFALRQHGMAMNYSKPNLQVVRMKANGRPYAGQQSVVKAMQRNGLSMVQVMGQDESLPRPNSRARRPMRRYR